MSSGGSWGSLGEGGGAGHNSQDLLKEAVVDIHVGVLVVAPVDVDGVGVQQLVAEDDGRHLDAAAPAVHQVPVEDVLRACGGGGSDPTLRGGLGIPDAYFCIDLETPVPNGILFCKNAQYISTVVKHL